ncbi:MAG: hypothetical protein ACRDBO_03495 [Lachnospiraceae bacterium]
MNLNTASVAIQLIRNPTKTPIPIDLNTASVAIQRRTGEGSYTDSEI